MQEYLHGDPHVSGLIRLMLSAGIPRQEIRDVLHRTSMPLGSGSLTASTATVSQRLLGGKCCGQDATDCEQGWQPGDSCGRDAFPGGSFALEGIPQASTQSVCLG